MIDERCVSTYTIFHIKVRNVNILCLRLFTCVI